MLSRRLLLAALVLVLLAGCGKSNSPTTAAEFPVVAAKGGETKAPAALGFPVVATKNTTRVPGADPATDAAAVAQAVYPSVTPAQRPRAVVLADGRDWRSALAASVLMSAPIRAPLLLGDGTGLPGPTKDALKALAPAGSAPAGGAQVVRVGNVARPAGLKTTDLVGRDAFELARAIDALQASARGASAGSVMVVSADRPEYAMPAAGFAAKSGDPILFVTRDAVPRATRIALAAHRQPRIYVLGPSSVISPAVTKQLRTLGTVVRIGAPDAAATSVAFARYLDGDFGWGVLDAGHGLVFANPGRPADAAAGSALSSSGTYGPLLLLDPHGNLPASVAHYLHVIQPGYATDPTRGVYNHGWIMGDDTAASVGAQADIDEDLEIARAKNSLPSQP